ncbi:uncharacterized protein LOC129588947 [Paramacrobiotus metropolitanus]|uniref:uncharacterized protein LOC129588947 n=1 Tax=Paramacrobiotus metropolitanus TaxID=2943436 RepID=UPI00244583B6|nr:uncharacterized protein LOC129588947 [Paramacrobiotus metropolitanus]
MSVTEIPIIDLTSYWSPSGDADGNLATTVVNTLRQHSCFLALNHGVPQHNLDDLMHQSREFFALPLPIKNQSARDPGFAPCAGYVGTGVEAEPDVAAPELRECFDLMLSSQPPAADPVTIRLLDCMRTVNQSFHKLTLALFDCISRGYNLNATQRDDLFAAHQHIGDVSRNSTMLRSAFYPAMATTQLTTHTRISPAHRLWDDFLHLPGRRRRSGSGP